MYKIEMITGIGGDERTDGRYPLRKGCIVDIWYLDTGDCMVLLYIKDNQGNEKHGYLRTSVVNDIEEYENGITVNTMNSVYYLKRL